MESFKSELRTTRPFYDFISAANYCLDHNIELEQALAWMDRAIYFRIMGVKNFLTLNTKAAILIKLNRIDEAKKLMEEALPIGTVSEVHYYGRTLLNLKQNDEALKVFKRNYEKFPNEYTTNVGMARAYSAKGDYKKALTYIKAALPQSPDEGSKARTEVMLKQLQDGKDVNSQN